MGPSIYLLMNYLLNIILARLTSSTGQLWPWCHILPMFSEQCTASRCNISTNQPDCLWNSFLRFFWWIWFCEPLLNKFYFGLETVVRQRMELIGEVHTQKQLRKKISLSWVWTMEFDWLLSILISSPLVHGCLLYGRFYVNLLEWEERCVLIVARKGL